MGWVGGGVGGPTMTPDPGAVHFTAEAAIQIWDLSIIPPFTSISSRTLSLSSISKWLIAVFKLQALLSFITVWSVNNEPFFICFFNFKLQVSNHAANSIPVQFDPKFINWFLFLLIIQILYCKYTNSNEYSKIIVHYFAIFNTKVSDCYMAESISKCKFTKSFCKRLHLEWGNLIFPLVLR